MLDRDYNLQDVGFNDFINYVQKHYSDHPQLPLLIRILECLEYIENNLDFIGNQVGKSGLLRHPTNHLAFHLHGLNTSDEAKQSFSRLIGEVKGCLKELLSIEDNDFKHHTIHGFLSNINDSNVGCMEVRLRSALVFAGLTISSGLFNIDTLMAEYNKISKGIFDIGEVLEFFSDKVNHHMLVQGQDKDIVPLTWQMIKNYLQETLGWNNIETDWINYGAELKQSVFIYERKTQKGTAWIDHCFNDEETANRYLDYIKSVFGEEGLSELSKASVKVSQDYNGLYYFSLTENQYRIFTEKTLGGKFIKKSQISLNDTAHPGWYIKSLRMDEFSFSRDFIQTITPSPEQTKYFSLRPYPKKKYTVKGKGVHERKHKTPQFSEEEKISFSQPQSVSFTSDTVQVPLFGFSRERRDKLKLIGFKCNEKDCLPNRMFIYDSGTIHRPYDFDDLNSAFAYYAKVYNRLLFDDIETFKEAIKNPENDGKYNEVLGRVRWNKDGSSEIIIGSDTLEARLLAQDFSRLLKKRLKEQARELGEEWDDSYQITLRYYMPGENIHNMEYEIMDQELDRQKANEILNYEKLYNEKIKEKNYEFLLGIDDPSIVSEIINKKTKNGQSLLLTILADGYVHIAQSLLEKATPEAVSSLTFSSEKNTLKGKAIEYAARTGDLNLVDFLINKCDLLNKKNKFRHEFLNKALIAAASRSKWDIVEFLLKLSEEGKYEINFSQKDSDGHDLLYYANIFNNMDLVKFIAPRKKSNFIESLSDVFSSNYSDFDRAFINAIKLNNFDLVSTLLPKLSNCNDVLNSDLSGKFLLHYAVEHRNIEMIELLVKHGAKFKEDKNGHTPIWLAGSLGMWDALELMVDESDFSKSYIVNEYAHILLAAMDENKTNLIKKILPRMLGSSDVINWLQKKDFFVKVSFLAIENKEWDLLLLVQPKVETIKNLIENKDINVNYFINSELMNKFKEPFKLNIINRLLDNTNDISDIENLKIIVLKIQNKNSGFFQHGVSKIFKPKENTIYDKCQELFIKCDKLKQSLEEKNVAPSSKKDI